MKAKSHGGLRYGSFFRQEDAFDRAQPKVLEIAVGPNAVNLAEGPRQGTLVDPGYVAQISHVHELFYIFARYLLEMIDNASIPLSWLCRSGRASFVPVALGHGRAKRLCP
jgi:hypothetical protein